MAAGVKHAKRISSHQVPRARGTWVFAILITLMFMAVGARLVQLQVMEHRERTTEVAKMLYSSTADRDRRGTIVDSKGIVLAASVAVKACALDPKVLLEAEGARPERLLGTLTETLELGERDVERLKKSLEKRYVPKNSVDGKEQPIRFAWVKRRITDEQFSKLDAMITQAKKEASEAWRNRRRWLKLAGSRKVARDAEGEKFCREAAEGWRKVALDAEGRFAGVTFPPEYRRVYPQGTLASHILGFGDIDGNGREGVERTCDSLLQGETINRIVARDARSRALSTMASDDRSSSGMTVELTLDSVVQAIVEEELQHTIGEFKREFPDVNAHAVVMDPYTGDILAIANYHTFDPNSPAIDPKTGKKLDPRNRLNDAVAAIQEPGSTFKPLLIAAAVEEKVASLDEMIDCATLRMNNGRRTIKDIHPYNMKMALETALVKSSNPAMVRVGQRLGPKKMREYVLKFGFGEKTGSRLPGEVGGRVTSDRKWSEWTMGSVPMGYEINVTTLQMAAAYSAIANGGMLPKPNIIRAIYDSSGGLALSTQPEMVRRVISEKTAESMRKVLRKVVTDGTGRRANIGEYHLGGKTGTANMIANEQERKQGVKGYSQKRHTANFVALAPWDKPKAVVCVSIRDTGKYGGEAAGPIMGRIVRRLMAYWGYQTENGIPIRADAFLPAKDFTPPPVPKTYTVGDEDDDNYLGEEVDSRLFEEWVEDENALG